jgi:hypothetical protein
MTSPAMIAAGIRAHAQGLCCPQATAELLIAQDWLHRDDFTSRFITVHPRIGSGHPAAVIDWPAAIAALGSSLPCSGGEQRMLKITASLADGIPVDLRDTITGLDGRNIQLLLTAIRRASGNSHEQREINGVSFSSEEQHCYEECEPEIAVSAGTAGQAAEVLALIGELIAAEPPVFAAIGRFLDAKGADQLPATGWLIDSISDLASRLGGTLETAGISVDRTLPRFRRPDRTR